MDNASSFFNLSMYEAMRGSIDDKERDSGAGEGNKKTRGSSDADVRRKKEVSRRQKPQRTGNAKVETKKSEESDVVLVTADELKEINKNDKKRNLHLQDN